MSAAPFPPFELARKVADAVLYEGYLLYPYRASAAKNQARWQFGVLMPRLWTEDGPEEPWATQTECLLEPEEATTVRVLVRFLHVQSTTVEAVDVEAGTFHEAPSLPVRRPSYVSPSLARARSCHATPPVRGLIASTTPSENLAITSATPS